MTKLQLSTTNFESIHHSSQETRCAHGRGIYHNVDVWNEIIINGQTFLATYQGAQSYCCYDYRAPSNRLEFAEGANSSPLLCLLNSLYELDFDDEELITEKLEEARKYCPHIDTIENLFRLYQFFNENHPGGTTVDFVGVEYTDNLDDYDEDGSTGFLILKNKESND